MISYSMIKKIIHYAIMFKLKTNVYCLAHNNFFSLFDRNFYKNDFTFK